MKKLQYLFFSLMFYIAGQAQIITTVAGGFGDGASALKSLISNPAGVAVDAQGNIYIADQNNNAIRKINAKTGLISTIAFLKNTGNLIIDNFGNLYITHPISSVVSKLDLSNGKVIKVAGGGNGGDSTLAISAKLNYPTGLALDSSGNLYIADYGDHRIRKINAKTGIITTIAGNGTSGYAGDGGLAANAILSFPKSLTFDRQGNLYIADGGNNGIRKVNANTGIISTLCSTSFPKAIIFDGKDSLYLGFSTTIYKINITTGKGSKIAGNGINGYGGEDSIATLASFSGITALYLDSMHNLLIADGGNNRIRKLNFATGIISTIVGMGTSTYNGDGIDSKAALLGYPKSVTIDKSGNLYFYDGGNNRIRKVDALTGIISTVVGGGNADINGNDTLATSISLAGRSPDIAVDQLGNLYFTDVLSQKIRKVNLNNGIITTIAGTGEAGFYGEGVLATLAKLNSPSGIAIDKFNNLYISEYNNHIIRKINASDGIISHIAGNLKAGYTGDNVLAKKTSLNSPTGLAIDDLGNLFILDDENYRIRKVDAYTGFITTVAGNGVGGYGGDGGPATETQLWYPTGLATDIMGNLYICDKSNNSIRKVNAKTGIITTIAGNGSKGNGGDGGIAISAQLFGPWSVAVESSGKLYIADNLNNRIRKVGNEISNNIITGTASMCLGEIPDSLIGTIPNGGFGTYAYTWLKSTISDSSGFVTIPNSNYLNYYPTALTQNTWFKRVVVAGPVKDTSNVFLITVYQKIIPKQPIITVISKTQLQSSRANSYQWYKDGQKLSGYSYLQNLSIKTNGIYTVKIDSTNGCRNTSNPYVASDFGFVEMVSKKSFRIYPNPSTSELHVETEGHDKLSLQLFDITGKEATEPIEFVRSTSINTQDLHEGIYFLKITDENGMHVKTEKVMVLR